MSAELNQAKHKLAKALLVKFSFLFPLPKETNVDAFVAIWRKAIEDLDEDLVLKAADNVLLTMTRFPYPADLRAEVKALQAIVDVKPINTGFPDTAIELIREKRLKAYELYCNNKNAEAYLERNGWERVRPAKAPQRNDSFPSMDGYEAWIEGGRTLDSAYEFIIAITGASATAETIQQGFWLEITGPGKVFIGWMRFVHLSNIKQKALFVASEFRFPCERAPDEKQVLCPSLIPEKWGNGYKKSVL